MISKNIVESIKNELIEIFQNTTGKWQLPSSSHLRHGMHHNIFMSLPIIPIFDVTERRFHSHQNSLKKRILI